MAIDAGMEPRVFLLEADALLATRRLVFLGEERFQAADRVFFAGPGQVKGGT